MNAIRQPKASVMTGTISGVTTAPTLAPALKMPVASARSFAGNHSVTDLRPAGKLPLSPMPRMKRATENWNAEPTKPHSVWPSVQMTKAIE